MIIGLAQTAYSMPEEDPSGQGNTVMVCIVLTGELDDDVEVVLTTMSGSATGDSSVLLRNVAHLLGMNLSVFCNKHIIMRKFTAQ